MGQRVGPIMHGGRVCEPCGWFLLYPPTRLVSQEWVSSRHGEPRAKVRWPLQTPGHVASQVDGQGWPPVIRPHRPHRLVAPTPAWDCRLAGLTQEGWSFPLVRTSLSGAGHTSAAV